ncbi:MAG: hypothetical protein Q4D76_17865 [Oscillospiraceae bacterium]|nr:hypothetical protein [Oscillospiraceae bacterium]
MNRKLLSMSKFITVLSLAICLTGCYTSTDLAEFTKEKLKEKYGEEFEIIYVSGDGHKTTVHPVNNPDLYFTAQYWMKSKDGRDSYIQEIVASQYKALAEDVIKDFDYDYYLDVDLEYGFESVDVSTDVTIEEYKKANPKVTEPRYYWYVSDEALEMSDEEIYDWINKIANITEQDDSWVQLFFIDNEFESKVKENYKKFSYAQESFYGELCRTLVRVSQIKENKDLKIDFERFKEIKKGI